MTPRATEHHAAEQLPAFGCSARPLGKGGYEILRAAIVEGGLQVSMWPAFNDREVWGILLTDITRHVARMYGTENGASEEETVDLIRSMFDAELDKPTDLGTMTAIS